MLNLVHSAVAVVGMGEWLVGLKSIETHPRLRLPQIPVAETELLDCRPDCWYLLLQKCICAHICMCVYSSMKVKGQLQGQVSPSTMWVLGIELRSSGLGARNWGCSEALSPTDLA